MLSEYEIDMADAYIRMQLATCGNYLDGSHGNFVSGPYMQYAAVGRAEKLQKLKRALTLRVALDIKVH